MDISDAAADALISVLSQRGNNGRKVEVTTSGNWQRTGFTGEMRPDIAKAPFVLFGGSDEERLFTPDESLLLAPFSEIIGDRAEVMLPYEDYYKIVVISKIHKLPRRIFAPPLIAPKHFYKLSFMKVRDGVTIFSTTTAVCESASGKVHGCGETGFQFIRNYLINKDSDPWNEAKTTAVLTASMVEDFRLDWRWHVSLADSAEIVFPTDALGAQKAFAMRDVAAGKRRKAILHWVKAHGRVKNERTIEVQEHLRGVTEFSVDGIRCKITSPEKLRKNK